MGCNSSTNIPEKATTNSVIKLDDDEDFFRIFCKFKLGKANEIEIRKLVDSANTENHMAKNYLGQLYWKGTKFTITDHKKAMLYCKQSFQWLNENTGNNKYRLCNLGVCYENGFGIEKNVVEAARLYKLAADQGFSYGQFLLAICYKNGIGVNLDKQESFRLYRLSGENGYIPAWSNVGLCYESGSGIAKNIEEAAKMYLLAAIEGHAPAQKCLAVCYDNGSGVSKDKQEATKWYRLAADQGYAQAQVFIII